MVSASPAGALLFSLQLSFPVAASQPDYSLSRRTAPLTSESSVRTATASARSPPLLWRTTFSCWRPRCTTPASCRFIATLSAAADSYASDVARENAGDCFWQDVFLRGSEQQWQAAVQAVPTLPSHIRLLRQWAQQRALEGQPDGLTGHILTMFAVYLVQQGVLVRQLYPRAF